MTSAIRQAREAVLQVLQELEQKSLA